MSSDFSDKLHAISDALREVIEGQKGYVRKLEQGVFKFGEFIGHPIEHQQKVAREVDFGQNWFDLEAIDDVDNPSTDSSAISDLLLRDVTFRIEFIRYVLHRSTIVDGTSIDNRFALKAAIFDVSQALGYADGNNNGGAGNLDRTLDGRSTGVLGGCASIYGMTPTGVVRHELENHLMRSELFVKVTVQVVQLVEET